MAKTKGIPAEERLMNLSAFLLGRRASATLREVLREVDGYDADGDPETNRRKFIRDKKELASLGINVVSDKTYDSVSGRKTDGYYIDPDEYYLPQINFTADEEKALSALESQIFDTGSAPFRELHWALMKIEASGKRRRPGETQSSPGTLFVHFDGDWNRGGLDLLDLVIDAVAARRTISVKYSSASSDASTRDLDPYGLFLRRGFWYLCAFCHLRGEVRLFRVDRMEIARKPAPAAKPDFQVPDDFSLKDFMDRRAPWEFGGADAREAKIRFSPDLFWRIVNAWGNLPSARFDDVERTMTVQSTADEALVRWALAYGDHAEILSPPALRSKIKDALKEIIANGA